MKLIRCRDGKVDIVAVPSSNLDPVSFLTSFVHLSFLGDRQCIFPYVEKFLIALDSELVIL